MYKRQGRTVAQLLGEVEVKTTRTLVLEPGAYPPALVLANFKDKDVVIGECDLHNVIVNETLCIQPFSAAVINVDNV